jgi:hypothetical protein
MNYIANLARSEGDPKILSTGPSSLASSDRLGRALGWFSLALGAIELLAPRRLTRALGMQGREVLVRAYGVRELGAGIISLSPDRLLGLWSRVAGDGLDLLTLAAASHPGNLRRKNVSLAVWLVVGVTLLDVVVAQKISARHSRPRGVWRDYGDRSGFPRGMEDARRNRAAG